MKTYTVRITEEEIRNMEACINRVDRELDSTTDNLEIGKYTGFIQGMQYALSMCGICLGWDGWNGGYILRKERKVTQK